MSGKGGARPGAGRPKTGKALEQGVSIKFSTAQLRYIDQLAERDSASRASMVRKMVDYIMQHVRKERDI